MRVQLRECEQQDSRSLRNLIIKLQNFEKGLEPTMLASGEDIADEFLTNLLTDTKIKKGKIFVAVSEKNLVGFVSGHIEETEEEIELQDKKFFYVSNIFVSQEFRSLGVGKRLLAKIVDFAKNIGLKQVQLNVLTKNRKAHNFYVNHGFREYENVLLKEL